METTTVMTIQKPDTIQKNPNMIMMCMTTTRNTTITGMITTIAERTPICLPVPA